MPSTGYYFTGPSFLEFHPFRRYPPTRLFSAVPYGLTVWRDAQGVWHQQYAPTLDQLAGADRVYAGGREWPLSSDQRAELVAAGYSAYITLKGLP